MSEKQNNIKIVGNWLIGGFFIGLLVGVVFFPDKMAVVAGIGMCLGICLAAVSEIIDTKRKKSNNNI